MSLGRLRRHIAREVRWLRETAGLTQFELAQKIGTRQPCIARLESGRVTPKYELLHRVARALGMRLVVKFEEKR